MNLRENKFYIGFGAVMLLGCLSLSWLLYQSWSDSDEADAKYQQQVAQLNALQTLPLYPETANLKILEEQKKGVEESVVALHQQLLPISFALEPMTPEEFQDKLNATVKSIEEKAAKAGVKLADKFYLGFAQYRAATPRTEAAAVLGRQLKCIELAIDTLIEKKVTSIAEVAREPLAEEGDLSKAPAPNAAANGRVKPGAPVPLVSKYPFKISFVADQAAFQGALNDLSKNDQQFFIIRPLLIKNQSDKSPKKVDPNADKAAASPELPVAGTAAPTPKPEPLQYVLGAEKINVTLRLDAVVFASNLPK